MTGLRRVHSTVAWGGNADASDAYDVYPYYNRGFTDNRLETKATRERSAMLLSGKLIRQCVCLLFRWRLMEAHIGSRFLSADPDHNTDTCPDLQGTVRSIWMASQSFNGVESVSVGNHKETSVSHSALHRVAIGGANDHVSLPCQIRLNTPSPCRIYVLNKQYSLWPTYRL